MYPRFLLIWTVLWTAVTSKDLYVSTPTTILRIDTTTLQTSTIITKENGRLLGLAADWRNERLYYTDVSPQGSGIYTANLQGGDARKLPIQYPDMEPVGLAVDWVYGHLYWTDTVYRAVMMSNLDGTGRVTIVTENLIIPRGIAVDPSRRELYVGDQGNHAVQICGLNGRDCRELNVTDSATFWPNQITIDHVSQRVHWTDGWIPAVFSCAVGGSDCRRNTGNLSTDLGSNPAFGIAADQNGQFYLSTLHNQSVYRSTVELTLTAIQIGDSNTKTFFLLNKETTVSQPAVSTTNPCATNKGGCSDICVAHSGNNFTCMCPDGSGKIPVNSVCQTPDRFLLYTDVSKGILGMASVDDPDKHTTIVRAAKPIAVTYHLVEKKVYFADARLQTIYKCDLDGGNIETVLNASHGIGQVEGFSIDYRQNRLYFSNMAFEDYSGAVRSWHAIEMLDLNSKKRRTILTSVEKPRAVLVDSENRVLYYTDWGSAGHVGRVSLDGSNRVVLATAEKPNDLVIHGNKLLVINNREPTAELLELDISSNSGVNRRPLSDIKPLSLSVSGSSALMISSFTGGLGIYSQSSLSRTYMSSLGQFTRMTVVDTTLIKQQDEGPCSVRGTCSDICVTSPKADSFTCLCPTNAFNELSPDRLSCQNPNSYILFADFDGIKMVSQGNPDDTHVYTIIYPSAACRHFYGLAVDEDQQYIYFSALQGNTIFRANADGSNMVKFVTEENSKITSLAMVGSDLFWTSSNSSDNSTGAIYHCDTRDTNRAVSVVYTTSSEPLDITADESNVYWTERDRPGVRRFDRRESLPRATVVSTLTSAIALSVPSSHLFYASPNSVTLRRFPTYSDASFRRDTIGEAGARTLMATSQFLYVTVWRENSTASIIRHNLLTKNRYDVTDEAVRPGQMAYISNQASTIQDKAGSCPSVPSCSDSACSLDVDCYGNSKCCGTSVCTRCVTPDLGTNCIKNGVYIKDSEDVVVVNCEKCSCLNGNLTCAEIVCPPLESCPEESRVKPPGSCCSICLVTTACSSPPTIVNCPSSTQTLLLSESSDSVNITLDSIIFASMYGKSCSGHKLNLNFPGTSLKWARQSQTVTVTATDKYGTATCSLSMLIIDKTKPTFEFCPSGVLQKYITGTDRIVAWSPVIARDNSGSVELTSNTENGIARSPGLHAVVYKAEDGSGNSDQCSFSINVTMLRVCSSPPIPFNGLLRCLDDRTLTCQLEKCNTGYLNTLSNNQQHICDPTDGKWLPPFLSNFSYVCIKPEPIIIQREYQFEFNCPNKKFETSDIKECILNARLCPSGDVRLCDLPFKRSESSSVVSPNQINIMLSMEGTLPHGSDRDELTSRMTNAGKKIEDFFQTEGFKTTCPKIPCQYSKSVTQADNRKCTMGSVMLNIGQEICAPCPAGWFYNENGQCAECPRDTYQERTGQTDCMPCSDGMSSSSGSFLQSHCSVQARIEEPSQNMTLIIVAAVIGAVVIVVLVSIACFFARKKSSAQIIKTGNFENPVFVGHGANEMAGSSLEVYDQIPADKMLSESQIQKHKQRMAEEDHYESRGAVYKDDQHTYEGLKGASNKGFNSTDDYDNPREQLLFGNDMKNDNLYSTVKQF